MRQMIRLSYHSLPQEKKIESLLDGKQRLFGATGGIAFRHRNGGLLALCAARASARTPRKTPTPRRFFARLQIHSKLRPKGFAFRHRNGGLLALRAARASAGSKRGGETIHRIVSVSALQIPSNGRPKRKRPKGLFFLVRPEGFEPSRFPRRILSPLCMPFHHGRNCIIVPRRTILSILAST